MYRHKTKSISVSLFFLGKTVMTFEELTKVTWNISDLFSIFFPHLLGKSCYMISKVGLNLIL